MRHDPYRWKSSLVMKGDVVTRQFDCAVAGSAASALTSPAFVAAMSVFCSSCAWLPSVSQITRYLVKARLVARAPRRGRRRQTEWLCRHPARQRQHFVDALHKRFENAVADTGSRLDEIQHCVAVGPRRFVVGVVGNERLPAVGASLARPDNL
jgi:hypothetical protein